MNKKTLINQKDKSLFRDFIFGTRKLKQDTIVCKNNSSYKLKIKHLMFEKNINNSSFYNEPYDNLSTDKYKYYVRNKSDALKLKESQNKNYTPEIILDLHGLNKQQAKQELGYLISICRRKKIFCAVVVTGHGKHILKQQIPFWLSQHPFIIAYYTAPQIFGGDAALLVLIET